MVSKLMRQAVAMAQQGILREGKSISQVLTKTGTKVEIKRISDGFEKIVTKSDGSKAVGRFGDAAISKCKDFTASSVEFTNAKGFIKTWEHPYGGRAYQIQTKGLNSYDGQIMNDNTLSYMHNQSTQAFYGADDAKKLVHYMSGRSDAPKLEEIQRIFNA